MSIRIGPDSRVEHQDYFSNPRLSGASDIFVHNMSVVRNWNDGVSGPETEGAYDGGWELKVGIVEYAMTEVAEGCLRALNEDL